MEQWLIQKGGDKARIIEEGRVRTKRVRFENPGDEDEEERKKKDIRPNEAIGEKRARDEDDNGDAIEEDRAMKYQAIEKEIQDEQAQQDDMIDYIESLVEGNLHGETYWDDLSGQELDSTMVRAAREEEMKEIYKREVYSKVPISEAWLITGKGPIGTRWVDVNKGDDSNPDYRSRLVAQEINDAKGYEFY